MRIGVTGASGFIGAALMPELAVRGHDALPLPRAGYAPLLAGVDVVIHLAGLAHRTGGDAPSNAAFVEANATLPVALFRAARDAGVPRMIHVSTIAVLSGHEGLLREDMPLAPTTPYDRAKAAAEAMLLAEAGGPLLTIIRPPLVYGPGAKANLRRLTGLAASRWPLPFGAVDNRRSMIGVANLADALIFLAEHPVLGIVHATDGDDLSLKRIVTTLRSAMGRPRGLVPVPAAVLRAGLAVAAPRMARQLLGDQRIAMTSLPAAGWTPPHAPEYDLARMAKAY